jgi:multisubunit Na+/H+ antiporter MnhE subunit
MVLGERQGYMPKNELMRVVQNKRVRVTFGYAGTAFLFLWLLHVIEVPIWVSLTLLLGFGVFLSYCIKKAVMKIADKVLEPGLIKTRIEQIARRITKDP